MIAEIILNANAKELDRTFDYNVPEEMKSRIQLGNRVLVPFGYRKKLEEGFVIHLKETSDFQTKPIVSIEENPFLNEEKIKLAKWIAKHYFCNLSDALKLMLPPGTKTKNSEKRIKEKTNFFIYLKKDKDEIEWEIEQKNIKSEKQIRVLRFLMEQDAITLRDLEIFTDTSRAIIKTLEKNGYIEQVEKPVERNPFLHKVVEKTEKLTFTEEQQKAYQKIEEAIEDKMHTEFLLFGVTGSRKNRDLFASDRKSKSRRKSKYCFSTRNFVNTTNRRSFYCQIWSRKNCSIT